MLAIDCRPAGRVMMISVLAIGLPLKIGDIAFVSETTLSNMQGNALPKRTVLPLIRGGAPSQAKWSLERTWNHAEKPGLQL